MKLTDEIISQFAKVVTPKKESNRSTEVYGTVVVSNGIKYLQLDGSTELTPMSESMSAANGDRVIAMIKNHEAVVTGNLTAPGAEVKPTNPEFNMAHVKEFGDGIMIANFDAEKNPIGEYVVIENNLITMFDSSHNPMLSIETPTRRIYTYRGAKTADFGFGEFLINGGTLQCDFTSNNEVDAAEIMTNFLKHEIDFFKIIDMDNYIADITTIEYSKNEVQISPRRINLAQGTITYKNDYPIKIYDTEVLTNKNAFVAGDHTVIGAKIGANSGRMIVVKLDEVPDGYVVIHVDSMFTKGTDIYQARINEDTVLDPTSAPNEVMIRLFNDTDKDITYNGVIKWVAVKTYYTDGFSDLGYDGQTFVEDE